LCYLPLPIYGVSHDTGWVWHTKVKTNNTHIMTRPTITKKQQEIVTLIPQFRFLDRTHIQSLLHHKDKQRINKWLKDLVAKNYLMRLYDESIIGTNRHAAIFYVGTNAIRYIRNLGIYDSSFLHKLYFEKKRSATFIQHCLLIATICCELERKTTESISYAYTTESDLTQTEEPFHFLKQSALSIDLVIHKKEKGKKRKYFLLTLIDATLPKYRLRHRIQQYREFYISNEWENNVDAPFPTVFIVCETKERMIYAKRYAKTLEELPKDFSIHFATAKNVHAYGITGSIWEGI